MTSLRDLAIYSKIGTRPSTRQLDILHESHVVIDYSVRTNCVVVVARFSVVWRDTTIPPSGISAVQVYVHFIFSAVLLGGLAEEPPGLH